MVEKRLVDLLTKDRPTADDIATARRLANGRFAKCLTAMEYRRQVAHPTPQEEHEAQEGAMEIMQAMQSGADMLTDQELDDLRRVQRQLLEDLRKHFPKAKIDD